MASMLLKKGEFAAQRGITPGRVSQLIRDGMPVHPTGMIDVEQATAWLDRRKRMADLRMPVSGASAPVPSAGDASLTEQLLAAKVSSEQAKANLTIVKLGERQGELGLVAEFRAESRRAGEMFRESYNDFGRSAAVSIAGRFGLDLGDVQVHMSMLVRDHMRKLSAKAKAEQERMEAIA